LRDITIEVDLREMKGLLSALNRKIDRLIEDRETLSVMVLAERSLKGFLGREPDFYSVKDIKVRYR
jgi:hypothetical protein